MINGVEFKELITYPDHRGYFRELLRNSDNTAKEGIGQISHSLVHAGVVKAWHAHKKEEKYFFCVEGSCQISCVAVNNFKNPNKSSKIYSWVLSDQKPEIIFIPKGYANGSMNFSINTKILVFSSSTLQQSASDDYRYPFDYWNPWSIIKR